MIERLTHLVRALDRRNRPLTAVSLLLLLTIPPLLVAAACDSRLVDGVNPWIKPLKFAVSFPIYFLTLGWLLAWLPGPRRAVHTISLVTALAVFLEAPILDLQAARGVRSHFNVTTTLDASLYMAMGVAAISQMVVLAWALWLFCTQPVPLRPLELNSIRAGVAGTLLGFVAGLVMVAIGHHTVGGIDTGPVLPLLNWNLHAGDLRIAHFLGLHAMQVVPLTGFCLSRWKSPGLRPWAVRSFYTIAAIYLLTMVLAFSHAFAGRPLLLALV